MEPMRTAALQPALPFRCARRRESGRGLFAAMLITSLIALIIKSPAQNRMLDAAMYEFQACVACNAVAVDDGRTGEWLVAQSAMQACQGYQAATMLWQKGYARSQAEAVTVFMGAAVQAVRRARAPGYCPPSR
jgi:hypothetical protein